MPFRDAAGWVFLAILLAHPTLARAQTTAECIVAAVESGDDDLTVREIQERCRPKPEPAPAANPDSDSGPAVQGSLLTQFDVDEIDDQVTLHRPTYFTASHVRDPSETTTQDDGSAWSKNELTFQLSFKLPLLINEDPSDRALFFAYTNRSWWQIAETSGPFREVNHEPELFVRQYLQSQDQNASGLLGLDLGINHQSNGRAGGESRSWNRLIAGSAARYEDLVLAARIWHAFSLADDNPAMHRFLGYGEVRAIYTPGWSSRGHASARNTYSLMWRPGTQKHSFEATWSRRWKRSQFLRWYAQYFNGYGESLIDFDQRIERFSIGFSLNDYVTGRDFAPALIN